MAWVPIVAAIAGGAASGASGKKSGSGDNPAAQTQARLASQLFGETDPIRQALIGRSADFLGISPQAPQASPTNIYRGNPSNPFSSTLYPFSTANAQPSAPGYAPLTGRRPFDVTASPE